MKVLQKIINILRGLKVFNKKEEKYESARIKLLENSNRVEEDKKKYLRRNRKKYYRNNLKNKVGNYPNKEFRTIRYFERECLK